jgi:hypothetical protein
MIATSAARRIDRLRSSVQKRENTGRISRVISPLLTRAEAVRRGAPPGPRVTRGDQRKYPAGNRT